MQLTQKLIEKFCMNTLSATGMLYREKLYGQMLVLLYSSIDSMGLLDARPTQTSASGESFKNWVKKCLLTYPGLEYNEVDLWAARCAVLHTFTSESDLSKGGRAREVQHYSGPKDSPMAKAFVAATKTIDNGKHVHAHIEDTYLAFLEALKVFPKDLLNNSGKDPAYEARLHKVLQQFALLTSNNALKSRTSFAGTG
ncbi:hypothetical protein SAMN05216535_0386 [Stutzerimonas xanthomarina]|uniref:Uncharacterized protein n=4 Tax=Stutzerimonas xanthomarina TaxID=271420 RepID=A0A1M5U345_9GAMM|nr:hypothetical protein SAMN05216535_0386 [Stutzerimonas xanthomarina]SHH57525.1 hypothetical protein SAMN02744645_0079 [Stutzerimonas xanthomarina DSM 18231]